MNTGNFCFELNELKILYWWLFFGNASWHYRVSLGKAVIPFALIWKLRRIYWVNEKIILFSSSYHLVIMSKKILLLWKDWMMLRFLIIFSHVFSLIHICMGCCLFSVSFDFSKRWIPVILVLNWTYSNSILLAFLGCRWERVAFLSL